MIPDQLREQIEEILDSADEYRMEVSQKLNEEDRSGAAASVDLAIAQLEKAKELIQGE